MKPLERVMFALALTTICVCAVGLILALILGAGFIGHILFGLPGALGAIALIGILMLFTLFLFVDD